MKRIIIWAVRLVALVLVLAGTAFAYLYFRKPAMAAPANVRVDMAAEKIARGKYIFTLADCDGCHSEHDYDTLYSPVKENRRGVGQFIDEADLPGKIYARNITPDKETGIGAWTDGEKIRAIREGISKDGSMLFPMMPYGNFRYMSDEDVQALVAYLNTLPAVRNAVPRSEVAFPVNLMIKSEPRPVEGKVPAVRPNDPRYGEYLVTLAECETCHTPAANGQLDAGKRFAGGREFKTPMGTVYSANITPDNATGLGNWDFKRFRDRIHIYETTLAQGPLPKVGPERFTLMPFENFWQLPDSDLEAIYGYIKSRPAIENRVEPHPDLASKGQGNRP